MSHPNQAPEVLPLIHTIRGQRVIIDSDLARLYGVETKRLNQQMRRNHRRFPPDFVFDLSKNEITNLRLQIATSSSQWGGQRHAVLAFTEHGAVMAANVLNSEQAVIMSVEVVRAFIRLRRAAVSYEGLARKVASLERDFTTASGMQAEAIKDILLIVKKLIEGAKEAPRKPVGFKP